MPMLEVNNIHTYYGNIHALKGISLMALWVFLVAAFSMVFRDTEAHAVLLEMAARLACMDAQDRLAVRWLGHP